MVSAAPYIIRAHPVHLATFVLLRIPLYERRWNPTSLHPTVQIHAGRHPTDLSTLSVCRNCRAVRNIARCIFIRHRQRAHVRNFHGVITTNSTTAISVIPLIGRKRDYYNINYNRGHENAVIRLELPAVPRAFSRSLAPRSTRNARERNALEDAYGDVHGEDAPQRLVIPPWSSMQQR